MIKLLSARKLTFFVTPPPQALLSCQIAEHNPSLRPPRFRKSSEEKMEFDAVFAALRAIADGEPIELSVVRPPLEANPLTDCAPLETGLLANCMLKPIC